MEKSKYCGKTYDREIEEIQDFLEYDFQNLKLSMLAQKIKSQAFFKPKPKMLFH